MTTLEKKMQSNAVPHPWRRVQTLFLASSNNGGQHIHGTLTGAIVSSHRSSESGYGLLEGVGSLLVAPSYPSLLFQIPFMPFPLHVPQRSLPSTSTPLGSLTHLPHHENQIVIAIALQL